MVKNGRFLSLIFSLSLSLLAASIVFFSYSLMHVVEKLPASLEALDKTVEKASLTVDSFARVSNDLPLVVNEVAAVRELVPAILAESSAIRAEVPPVLDRIDKIEADIPLILQEVSLVREALVPLLMEVEAYRLIIPEILASAAAFRTDIPPALDRLDKIVQRAGSAGQQASEGAVTGFFTGMIKAPFNLMSGFSQELLGGELLDKSEKTKALNAAMAVIDSGVVGDSRSWKSRKNSVEGDVVLLEIFSINGRSCRKLRFSAVKKQQLVYDNITDICKSATGEWELIVDKTKQ